MLYYQLYIKKKDTGRPTVLEYVVCIPCKEDTLPQKKVLVGWVL